MTLDENMVYADARLSTHAPTVEVRVADVCLAPEDAAVPGVLVRALVETAAADRDAGRRRIPSRARTRSRRSERRRA